MSDNEDSDDNLLPDGQMENGHIPDDELSLTENNGANHHEVPTCLDQFDVGLPTTHRYLGKLDNVSGYQIYDDNEIAKMLAIKTNTLVLPGFTLPLVVNNDLEIDAFHRYTAQTNAFVLLTPDTNFYSIFPYGVIMEIFEYHIRDSILYLKAKSRQRCKLVTNKEIFHLLGDLYQVTVQVLPEPKVASPISTTQLLTLKSKKPITTNDFEQFAKLGIYRKYHLSQFPLPSWIYDKHEICFLMNQLIKALSNYYLIDYIPDDPKQLSYWFLQNFQLKHSERLCLMKIGTTVERLRLELKFLFMKRLICCTNCQVEISKQSDVFAMSKDGAQSNYCNPGGNVFETVTVMKAINFKLIGIPTTQFSWFPGYAWTIMQCKKCNYHLGWRFTSSNLKPDCFYGLAKSGIDVKIIEQPSNEI